MISRQRHGAAREAAAANFQTLLTEKIKDPEAVWSEAGPCLCV